MRDSMHPSDIAITRVKDPTRKAEIKGFYKIDPID